MAGGAVFGNRPVLVPVGEGQRAVIGVGGGTPGLDDGFQGIEACVFGRGGRGRKGRTAERQDGSSEKTERAELGQGQASVWSFGGQALHGADAAVNDAGQGAILAGF
ncbi:hypothetical protein LL06_18230 [Hoeflea sp. BAL378]|nr:hypothetical protein LL06_18230 [Hoeflea sp. BAL378]